MDQILLATKVRIPPLPQRFVQRDRLVDLLERAVIHHKLVVVSASAGYGKTTLLSDWAHRTGLRVGWLSLGDEDNDLGRFLRYLVAAWEILEPDILSTRLGLLLEPMSPDVDQVLRAVVNLACKQEQQTAFVLDDVHLIEEQAVFDALAFLIDHLPPHFHFMLAGRGEPPLPISRYRASSELHEFNATDIVFQKGETGDFFRNASGIDLSDADLTTLHSRLEGWVAGMQLVSLTTGHHLEVAGLPQVSGQHRFIADYLRDEILANLDGETRQFLVQTSILDRLCGSLCDAVTGGNVGQEMLEHLERKSLFISSLDERREWFRYHPVFAEYLQEELRQSLPDQLVEFHRRAAEWYLDHDLPESAFKHAVIGEDIETGTHIFDSYVVMKLESGEFRVVQQWLESTPPDWFVANPSLGLFRAAYLVFVGDVVACLGVLDEIEDRLGRIERDDTVRQLARVAVARCAIACFQNDMPLAESYARQALNGLRHEDVTLRANIYHALADTYRRNHLWSEARSHYQQIMDMPHDPSWKVRSAHVYGAMADLELMQGNLRKASKLWQQAREAIEQPGVWGLLPVPIIGWVYIRMAELFYEWNELSQVSDLLPLGLERAEAGGDVRAMIAGYLIGGRLMLTRGDLDLALSYLERARPLVEQTSFDDWTSCFERLQLEVWLAQNRLRAAVEWSDLMRGDGAPTNQPGSDMTQLAVARVLVFKGDGPSRERALTWLDSLIVTAGAEERKGVQIEGLALRSLALRAAGDDAGAMTSLEHALRLAEPEGYVRSFVDLGLPMGRLLQEAGSRDVMPEYVDRLLAACGVYRGAGSSSGPALPEVLSAREQEILGLVAAGLTNREIAGKLFISAETVKKHTGNLYAKLQVGRRTEAVVRARELHLLDP